MGFSVSGSAAIIFAAMFIAFGMFYTATTTSADRVTDATDDWRDRSLDLQNAAITVENVTVESSGGTYAVNATVLNTGGATLAVSRTDFLIDNTYQTAFVDRAVEGDGETDLWVPGERLTANMTVGSAPSRLRVVTDHGVAATEVIA
ncbi:flagellin [Halococcoides cellulosivorans]|uniref:Flagellin n=1 Tax=Halococcoides cellulosivorans TaxID=1679096 RepID=A0A2R4X262_9EURY|nr:flagellin [Halococcoides cellulosivorans]AWB27874.1 flagellin [Halococcoides cellulosivorans]